MLKQKSVIIVYMHALYKEIKDWHNERQNNYSICDSSCLCNKIIIRYDVAERNCSGKT